MRAQAQQIPVAMEQPGLRLLKIESPDAWGGMTIEYMECSEKFDFRPLFEGLPDDKCTCPHWGYMLKGAMHMEYADNTSEVMREGDVWYMPEGHTGWCEASSAMIVISPEADAARVAEHIATKMQG